MTLYLEEHGRPDADRVKDIVRAALIAESCTFSRDELARLLVDRAAHRDVLSKLARPIPAPPRHWQEQFEELSEQAQSSMTMQQAMKIIGDAVEQVRG